MGGCHNRPAPGSWSPGRKRQALSDPTFLRDEAVDGTSPIHSFIVKVQLHPIPGQTDGFRWRAQIAHVPSGRRRYVQRWDEVIFFILEYLQPSGTKLDLAWRFRRWLYQWPRQR
jgi:hypothetical protein